MRRLALIAVHGVANQKAGDSARQVAELLLRLPEAQPTPGEESPPDAQQAVPRYQEAEEVGLVLPVRPVDLKYKLPERGFRGLADQRSACQRAIEEDRPLELESEQPDGERVGMLERPPEMPGEPDRPGGDPEAPLDAWLNHEEMREQLHLYRPERSDSPYRADATYRTARLSVHRRVHRTADRIDVHELFWADLSRLGDSILGVFFDFYQLLFFLCGLGTTTLNRARAHYRSRLWGLLRFFHRMAETVLVLVIPILNLTLLTLASVLLVIAIPVELRRLVMVAVPVILTAAALGFFLFRRRRRLRAQRWPLWFLALLASAALIVWLQSVSGWLGEQTLAFLLWLVTAGLMLVLLISWNRTRPGALKVGAVALIVMAAFFARELWLRPADESAASTVVPTHLPGGLPVSERGSVFDAAVAASAWAFGARADGESQWGLLGISWAAFFLFTFLANLTGLGAALAAAKSERKRACAVVWTASLTLTLPGLTVLIVNIALWQALANGASLLEWNQQRLIPELTLSRLQGLVNAGTMPYLELVLAGCLLAVLAVVWSVLPALRGELAVPSAEPRTVLWLGDSLRAAIRWIRVPGELLRILAVLGVPAIMVLMTLDPQNTSSPTTRRAVLTVGILLFVMVTGSRGPLRFLALGFRAALDIALDVANWLRLEPVQGTPRARIAARYASLLRHICRWRDPSSGEPYGGLVIVAHSQGTVITADLLRFLQREASVDPDLGRLLDGRLPVYLFTMGCPLRQLYGRRLPFRYGWARNQNPPPFRELPEPADLGVRKWVNAYRSGDYVGRYLWHNPLLPRAWDPRPGGRLSADNGRWTDFCIGSGGHIHYWDPTAGAIGRELDRLIAEAL